MIRPGSDVAVVVWPSAQVPSTGTPGRGGRGTALNPSHLPMYVQPYIAMTDEPDPRDQALEVVRQAAADLRDATDANRKRRELRDRAVIRAVDNARCTQRAVAQAAGIALSTVTGILGQPL